MEIITLNQDNLEKEHICCAIANDNDLQVRSKKEWLKEKMKQGLVFKKMDVRGKCFIEYLPLEHAGVPITGAKMMFINCLWVAGKFQGQGYASRLLEACLVDCKEKGIQGIVIIATKKKMPFIMDYKFLVKHGFRTVDAIDQYELMYLSLNDEAIKPQYTIHAMTCKEDGLVLYYRYQCPFVAKYVPIIEAWCQEQQISFKTILSPDNQNATLFPTYSLFYQHQFITREILSVKKFSKIVEAL